MGGASDSGDIGRMGGVLNRGGLFLPVKDSRRAEDKADSRAGIGSEVSDSTRPGSGVCTADGSSEASCAGVGIWRTAAEPGWKGEGTGEPRRAVECMRETMPSASGDLLPESLDVEETGLGRRDSGRSSAMTIVGRLLLLLPPLLLLLSKMVFCDEVAAELRLSSCNAGDAPAAES